MRNARCTTILPPPMPGTDSYAYFAMFVAPPPPRDPVFGEEIEFGGGVRTLEESGLEHEYGYEMDSVMPNERQTEPASGELPTTPCLDIAV